MQRSLKINGDIHIVDTSDDMPLLWVIRDHLKLTGTKYGCGIAMCGACTVHLDSRPTRACATRMGDIDGASITTIEGLAGRVAAVVAKAWDDLDVAQCGYCQPGQIMSAVGLLAINPAPTDQEIDDAMTGNICRCAAYVRIKQAVRTAAEALQA